MATTSEVDDDRYTRTIIATVSSTKMNGEPERARDVVRTGLELNVDAPERRSTATSRRKSWLCLFDRVRCCCLRRRRDSQDEVPDKVQVPPRSEEETSFKSGVASLVSHGFSMVKFTNLLYKSSFPVTMLWMFLIYCAFIVLFSLIIFVLVSLYNETSKKCLTGWNYNLEGEESFQNNMEIAMDLSWTTLSTVGFGTVSPPQNHGCAGLRWLLSFEAFFGILFGGFCGAIFYSKVARLNTRAPVTFSSAVCLQFGNGITEAPLVAGGSFDYHMTNRSFMSAMGDSQHRGGSSNAGELEVQPFPVLEFRAINDKLKTTGNELLRTSMKCVALSLHPPDDIRESLRAESPESPTFIHRVSQQEPLRRQYEDMEVLPHSHPFWDAVCYFRHVLNENSPLLKPSVRERLADLGGWPDDLNDSEAIRGCFSSSVFEFVVSIEGTSNLSAQTVFKLHRYTFQDIYIGWRFVGLVPLSSALKKDPLTNEEYRSMYDLSRVHDIMPQHGGGNEPIGDRSIDDNLSRFFTIDGYEE